MFIFGSLWLLAVPARGRARGAQATSESAVRDKVLRFIREKWGLPDSVKVSADPLHPSPLAGFQETTVKVDDGKTPKLQHVFVSDDTRYLIVGQAFPIGGDREAEIVQRLRQGLNIPATMSIKVEAFKDSSFPNFLEAPVSFADGTHNQTQTFYATKDNAFFIVGKIYAIHSDLRREALRTIVTRNQPSQGPATAPVTIVEYSDLQCPGCAKLHEFLENQLLPKYGDRVRIIFKEFPLPIHDWTMTAATAAQCAYGIKPSAFVPYRTTIFAHQSDLNVTNARDLLLSYGEQAGIDRLKLSSCMDSKTSLPRIQENQREGKALGIESTPTSYVNGRVVLGVAPPETFYEIVDEALRSARTQKSADRNQKPGLRTHAANRRP